MSSNRWHVGLSGRRREHSPDHSAGEVEHARDHQLDDDEEDCEPLGSGGGYQCQRHGEADGEDHGGGQGAAEPAQQGVPACGRISESRTRQVRDEAHRDRVREEADAGERNADVHQVRDAVLHGIYDDRRTHEDMTERAHGHHVVRDRALLIEHLLHALGHSRANVVLELRHLTEPVLDLLLDELAVALLEALRLLELERAHLLQQLLAVPHVPLAEHPEERRRESVQADEV
mmetsp:Transcript_73483/g.208085  ORF Transcript_73483/g.208085 Transcript_73483/m.208085 type:complete len:232 (+) Transcript_73483:699-1394(+)